jgi:NADH-quinone oxidoreductase subunit F
VKGSLLIHQALHNHLGINEGEDTDRQREYTLKKVACLGCCTLAPVMQIDGSTFGRLTPESVGFSVQDFERSPLASRNHQDRLVAAQPPKIPGGRIRVGLGSCCIAKGSFELYESLRSAAADLGASVAVERVGCVGMCHRTPLVQVDHSVNGHVEAALYENVTPDQGRAIVAHHFPPRRTLTSFRLAVNQWLDSVANIEREDDGRLSRQELHPRDPAVESFMGAQTRIATEGFGRIDPCSLDQYMQIGGFQAAQHCLEHLSPEETISQITRSGLRGRGGAGFPSGEKWARVKAAAGDPKYVICNGDEGDPGAFMDRMLMESFPFRILEGMMIAAHSVGAREGILYVRREYPLALARIRAAIEMCCERGLVGDSLFGTTAQFHVSVNEGAGAFICGEETALIASLEGSRPNPRPRPPYPSEQGFMGRPTLVNNVESLSLVPWIVLNGPEEFAKLGTDRSRGTKVFSLAGRVRRGGLIEVEMGLPIRRIVEEIGGGIEDGRRFKAVQVGGPSGGCIPADLCDVPVDYEALVLLGAIMGSGGLVVLDDRDCMVDLARYFLRFTQSQSCGRCTPCRIGSTRMLEILERICEGRGRSGDLSALEDLARHMKQASLCGLGVTAPNPILTTLRYFREEYEAHLDGRCPAGRCAALVRYRVNDCCIGCTICAQHCPSEAISAIPYRRHEIDDSSCTRCDLCRRVCPHDAIEVN